MKLALPLVALVGTCVLWPDLSLEAATLLERSRLAAPREEVSEIPQPAVPEMAAPQPTVPQGGSPENAETDVPQALVPGGSIQLKTTLVSGRLRGTIKSLDNTQMTVVVKGGEELIVPWSSIKRLDVQVGVRHRYGTGVLIGGGLGAFFGLIIPNHQECFAPGCPDEERFARSQAVVIGGILGAITGLLVEGASDPSAPKWERVSPQSYPSYRPAAGASVGFGVTSDRNGPAVQLVVTF